MAYHWFQMAQINRYNIGFLVFFFSISSSSILYGKTSDPTLELTDTSSRIENILKLFIPGGTYRDIMEVEGNRILIRNPELIVNGDSVKGGTINTRGKTTLLLRRKSFNIELEQSIRLFLYGEDQLFKKFYAISLSMDKHYFRNRISFEMMKILGLFELFNSYGELKINGNTEGVYLLVERPQDWALKKIKSPFIIRRGFDHHIDKYKTGKKTDPSVSAYYKKQFRNIYRSLNRYEGEELYAELSRWIDLDMYMKWLAFNFFIRNGDYTDEVYFYIDPSDGRFRIIPWDYDDIFSRQPHEGKDMKLKTTGQNLIFSSEDDLDKVIASDPGLYNKYLLHLKEMLVILNPEILKGIFEDTYSMLYPYYKEREVIESSAFDPEGRVDLDGLELDMKSVYFRMIQQRTNCLNFLH